MEKKRDTAVVTTLFGALQLGKHPQKDAEFFTFTKEMLKE